MIVAFIIFYCVTIVITIGLCKAASKDDKLKR